MDFPAEIVNNATAIIDHSSHWVTRHVEGQLGDFAWKQVMRAIGNVFPALAEIDPRELAKRMGRMEEAFYGLQDELDALKSRFPQYNIDAELLEPSAQDFVSDAFVAIMESPSNEKRNLLGRLIAQRLYATTESRDELYLRQAESLTRRMNTPQLWAMATLYLVHYPALPIGLSRDELYIWMDKNLLPVLDVVCKVMPTDEDLDYLTSLGAVTNDGSATSNNLSLSEHAPSIEQRVLQATSDHFEQLENKDRGRFYNRAYELYNGKLSREQGQVLISLSPYGLSVPGIKIAEIIVAQLQAQQVMPPQAIGHERR